MNHTYRAWIKAENRMVYNIDLIDFKHKRIGIYTIYNDSSPHGVWVYYDFNLIDLMLGTEIRQRMVYEGDIVEAYWTDAAHRAVGEVIGEVVFKDGAFRFISKKYKSSELCDYEFFVLGNKFENPKLLEK